MMYHSTSTYVHIHKYKYCILFENENKCIGFENNYIFIRNANENIKLKIKTKNRYPFLRINFQVIIPKEIWFAKFPNSDDLIILKKMFLNEYEIYCFQNQWKYRFIFLSSLKSNPSEIL